MRIGGRLTHPLLFICSTPNSSILDKKLSLELTPLGAPLAFHRESTVLLLVRVLRIPDVG